MYVTFFRVFRRGVDGLERHAHITWAGTWRCSAPPTSMPQIDQYLGELLVTAVD